MNVYGKSCDCQTKWIYFLIEDDDLLKKLTLFGITSVLILKKNLMANLSTIKSFEHQNKIL